MTGAYGREGESSRGIGRETEGRGITTEHVQQKHIMTAELCQPTDDIGIPVEAKGGVAQGGVKGSSEDSRSQTLAAQPIHPVLPFPFLPAF